MLGSLKLRFALPSNSLQSSCHLSLSLLCRAHRSSQKSARGPSKEELLGTPRIIRTIHIRDEPSKLESKDIVPSCLGKRKRGEDTDESPAEVDLSKQPSKRDQSMSARFSVFTPEFLHELQDAILEFEHDPMVAQACISCRHPGIWTAPSRADYRCLDCFHSSPLCAACLSHEHKQLPFHRIQRWTGLHFERVTLKKLDYVLNFGHLGKSCPLNKEPATDLVVVHTNGIHQLKIRYCLCGRQKQNWKALQLTANRLFPASPEQPQTAFTFTVLKDFHRHSLSAKTSAYDYFDAIQKHSDAVFPQNHPDRYRELMAAMRFWRYLALLRRLGVVHNIHTILTHRRPGSLAVQCPACPEIGFNVEEDVLKNVFESQTSVLSFVYCYGGNFDMIDRHLYTLFISIDGNFRLQRKRKNNDPNDKALGEGRAYFVENAAFKAYLNSLADASKDNTKLCSNLKAVRQQDRIKFRDAVISGIIATQCARHQFYLEQGMADLERGESYARTDYALGQALSPGGQKQRWIMVTYDIWCQYHKNLPKRFKDSEYLQHLHPTIKKSLRGSFLLKQCKKWSTELRKHHSHFEKLSAMYPEAIVAQWTERFNTRPNAEVYQRRTSPPTRSSAYESLIGKERSELGIVGCISEGLEIENILLKMKGGESVDDDDGRALFERIST
ncbi:hypothetical protein NP233_g7520 [Leucocoprinus birnbaumii]|uniref:CxC2-like cysteine cluster KDZ transposase-associated domain-containing protein n=1 Tax=Leucocoprinus birnbaumii TaxID=56174 RepID=A0AAD5YPW4_9AGAR|nr:hypothetical protein NP233_g7520 [Leucocoprinus birnbaumii]